MFILNYDWHSATIGFFSWNINDLYLPVDFGGYYQFITTLVYLHIIRLVAWRRGNDNIDCYHVICSRVN